MMVNQEMDAAQQDVENLKPLGDDETHSASISPLDKIVNNEKNVDKSVSETMPMAADEVMESETTNHELELQGVQGDQSSKVSSSKLEDEKESKIEDKTELVEVLSSSPLVQVDDPLESSMKTGDNDKDRVDNNDIPESESKDDLKAADDDNDDDNKTSDEVERDVDSRERSCSTTSNKTSDSPNGQESRSQPPLVKDAKILVSQVSEVAEGSGADTVKGFSGFDLNQEVCSEEVDNPVNPVSSTISEVVSAQPSAASGISSTPLQFEGILGLKESIMTSPEKPIPDGTHNNSRRRLECLAFDLNAVDGCENKTLPSGEESSVEAYPRGPTKMQLDLNSIMDEGCDGHVTSVNETRWQSPARSSSSSSKQPSLKNIDLNLSDQAESVILFGTKLGVKKNDHPAQPGFSNLGPTQYGHNGFASEAPMFFHTPMHGAHTMPIPYMVDSRGYIVPQILGSSLAPPLPFPQHQPPFLMNMAPAGSSGFGPSDNNLGPSNNVLRQFLPQNGNEEYLRTSSPSGSIIGAKRQVPDSGWDYFSASKQQQQHPWR